MIPKFLINLGVVEADVIALGSTINTLTLAQCQTLSVAKGASGRISVIFPASNIADDFEESTTFNEVNVKPNNTTSSSGLNIENANHHPLINLVGSSNGRGLIQFSDAGAAKGLIYSSAASQALRVESNNEKLILEFRGLLHFFEIKFLFLMQFCFCYQSKFPQ